MNEELGQKGMTVTNTEFPAPSKENTLYLTIKQVYFDEIVAGTKKEEYREMKYTTYKKYLEIGDNGMPFYYDDCVRDEELVLAGDIFLWNEGIYPFVPRDLYYLDLAVGYNKERDTARVAVEYISIESIENEDTGKPFRFSADEEGNITYDENGRLCLWNVVFHLGDIVELHRK